MGEGVHTKLPWKLEEIAPDDPAWEAFEIWSELASAKMVANGSGTANMRVFGRNNAALIVRSVNSLPALVAALENSRQYILLQQFEYADKQRTPHNNSQRRLIEKSLEQVDAALKLGRGEQ